MAINSNIALTAVIKAKDEASKTFNSVGKSSSNLMGNLTKLGIAAGVAGVAIAASSVKMAADFDKSMSNVSTLIDTTKESMEDMSNQVLEMSRRIPVEISDLSTALYDVRSAGISASDAMMVLEKSAMLGVAGLGTTQEAVNLATSAINSFGLEGDEATKAFDTIMLTVKSGKTNISELAQSFGMVSGVANTAGVSFDELMAATAALTTSGLKSSVAQTQLRAAILAIQAPTKDMAELVSDLGYKSGEAMIKELGLVGSMKNIDTAADGNVEQLKKAYGSVEALGAGLSLTGEQGGIFKETLKEMEDGEGALDEAFKKQNTTAAAQYQLLKNNLNVEMIKLGNKILPMIIDKMPELIKFVEGASIVFLGLVDGILAVADAVGETFGLIEDFALFLSGLKKEDLSYTMRTEQQMKRDLEVRTGKEWGGFEEGFTGKEVNIPYNKSSYSFLDDVVLDPAKQYSTNINIDLRGSTVTDEEITQKISDNIFKKVGYYQLAK